MPPPVTILVGCHQLRYAAVRYYMSKAIVSIEDHAAGMQLLAALPDHFDDQQIAEAARRQGVVINALSSYYAEGKARKGLVLGFCGFDESEIETNVSTITEIIKT